MHRFSPSLHIPTQPTVLHTVYSSLKTHPVSCKLLVPPLSLSLPLSSASPVPQNVWIDVNGVIVTALPAVCNSTSASQRLWKVWREQRERKKGKGRGKERGRKVPLNNKAWRPSRESSLASGVGLFHVPLSLPLPMCSQLLFPSFSHTVLFRVPIPCRTSHLQPAVYSFCPPPFHYSALSTQPVPYSLSCFNRGRGGVVVGVCTREKTKPPNLGLSFTHEVSCCIRGASCRCRMSRHSKSLALRMWVIWSRGTKVRCLPVNGAFSRWHGEKRVNKHHRPGAALKCFGCILLSTPPIQACYYPAHEWISEPAFDMGIMLLLVKIPYQTLSFTSTAEEADSLPFFPLLFFELEENQIKA